MKGQKKEKIEENVAKGESGKTVKEKGISALLGIVTGFINGLFGGGGGMIIVPLLTFVMKKKTEKAHATAILIILPLCIISSLLYSAFGKVELSLTLYVGIGVTVGGLLGAILLSKLSNKIISCIFAVLMCIAGVKLVVF